MDDQSEAEMKRRSERQETVCGEPHAKMTCMLRYVTQDSRKEGNWFRIGLDVTIISTADVG